MPLNKGRTHHILSDVLLESVDAWPGDRIVVHNGNQRAVFVVNGMGGLDRVKASPEASSGRREVA